LMVFVTVILSFHVIFHKAARSHEHHKIGLHLQWNS
jgi:hypothetical protein